MRVSRTFQTVTKAITKWKMLAKGKNRQKRMELARQKRAQQEQLAVTPVANGCECLFSQHRLQLLQMVTERQGTSPWREVSCRRCRRASLGGRSRRSRTQSLLRRIVILHALGVCTSCRWPPRSVSWSRGLALSPFWVRGRWRRRQPNPHSPRQCPSSPRQRLQLPRVSPRPAPLPQSSGLF